MKQNLNLFLIIAGLFLFFSCQKPATPSNLNINNITFEQTHDVIYLDLPDGTYMPDNPDFNINNPLTWTGNMAQYVKHNFFYTVNYQISNSGGSIAYDTEVDLHYIYDNGDEEVETIYIGNVSPGANLSKSTSFISTNKELTECFGEVFWYY